MARTYDEGYANVINLSKEFQSGRHNTINEDTTRLRFIDGLFLECLDWDRYSQVETEERTDIGIIDYSFNLGGTMLVVEAKKTGIGFSLPLEQGRSGRLIRSIESIASLSKEVDNALAQAARYALEKGAPFAVVSNGWQIIAFSLQLGPGIGWRKGRALVFQSLNEICSHFAEFWNTLSVEAVRRFELKSRLMADLPSKPCPRRSALIPNYKRSKNRNDFQADLQILGDLVFGGRIFEDRQLFHEHCYCAGGAIPQFSRATKSYLEDRYPEFFSTTAQTPTLEPAQTRKGPAAALTNLTNIRKPILLLGDVGVGKTTFLERLFLVDWADREKDLIVLRVDLGDKPSRSEDLPDAVSREIEDSLLRYYGIDIHEDRFLRGVYHAELMRFKRSPEGALQNSDPPAFVRAEIAYLDRLRTQFDDHLRAIFSHLVKARKKMVVLIFDNVDQRSSALQKATFIQAQVAASKWDIFVMVALRPETFVRSKLDGELAGYHPRAFTISPPRFDDLMAKRIDTAIRMLRGELPIPNIGGGAKVQVQEVADYLEVLMHSFTQEPELLSFCEDISCGNMRLALDYIVAFMACGHVDAKKILERWRGSSKYKIPLHEFARGVMFADREYYSGDSAAIMNVFDCHTGDPREAFIVIAVLDILSIAIRSMDSKAEGVGYVATEELKRNLVGAGFRYDQASWATERCLSNRLIETNLKSGDLQEATHVRLSPTGSYYYLKLIRTFVYVDAVCVDSPICNHRAYDKVTDVTVLHQRITRTKCFIDYLDGVYAEFPSLRQVCDWGGISAEIRQDLERVRDSNEKALVRNARA